MRHLRRKKEIDIQAALEYHEFVTPQARGTRFLVAKRLKPHLQIEHVGGDDFPCSVESFTVSRILINAGEEAAMRVE